jgi:predicted RNase H-like nuclease (RuvC/YqgF family)
VAITGIESKASSALSGLKGSDHEIQQVGVVIKDLATAVERLSREVDDLKEYVRDLEREANHHLQDELEER